MKYEIKHRFSGGILFSLECGSLKICLEAAVESGAYLDGAYLAGANLADAYLAGANLTGAYLAGANLARAYLAGANLTGAYLAGANLARAYLAGANLARAYLAGANLTGAYLAGANLARAYLAGANLTGAIYDGPPPASKEESIVNLDRVAEIILDDEKRLHMNHWHDDDKWKSRTCAEEATCGTTHCLAGWLQVCSTDERVRKMEPSIAGYLMAPVAAKMFYKTNNEVLSWLKTKAYVQELA